MFDTRVPLYGICLVSGLVLGFIFIYINAKNIKLDRVESIGFILFLFLGAIVGAKYYTLLSNFSENKNVSFLGLGLSSYGAVIGIILMILLYAKIFNKKFMDLLYICMPSIPLMYAVGKIGCFLAGCCHGIEYDGIFKVTYNYSVAAEVGSYFPVQLLETIIFLIIFAIIMIIFKKLSKKNVIGIAFVLCGIAKFGCEFLRISHVGKIISSTQIVSIIFIVVGSILIMVKKKF